MKLRKRLYLEEVKREGFEDGLSGSETEPLYFENDTVKVTYRDAVERGRLAARGLELRIARKLTEK